MPGSVREHCFFDGKTAAAVATNEEGRPAQLARYRYIRFHQMPAVRFSIPGFQQLIPSSQRHIARNVLATMDTIYVESDTGGYVSFCGRDESPGLISLGDCSSNIDEQLQSLQQSCKWTPALVEDPKQRRTSHPARVRYLVSIELNQYRLVEEQCKGCNSRHWFWFNAPHAVALTALERWRQWVEREPFTSDGVLKRGWQERADKERQHLLGDGQTADFSLTQWLDEFVSG